MFHQQRKGPLSVKLNSFYTLLLIFYHSSFSIYLFNYSSFVTGIITSLSKLLTDLKVRMTCSRLEAMNFDAALLF